MTTELQIKALHIGVVTLEACKEKIVNDILSNKFKAVVPQLLLSLSHPHRAIRHASIKLIDELLAISSEAKTGYSLLLTKLLKHRAELLADPAHLQQAFEAIFSEKLESKSPKKKTDFLTTALQSLLGCILDPNSPFHLKAYLLSALDLVDQQSVLESLLPLLGKILDRIENGLDQYQTMCAHLIIQRFTPEMAPVFERKPQSKKLFETSSRTDKGHHKECMSLQGVTLHQVSKDFFAALTDDHQQDLLALLFDLWLETQDSQTAASVSKALRALSLKAEQIIHELDQVETTPKAESVKEKKKARRLSKPNLQAQAVTMDSRPWKRTILVLEMLHTKKKIKTPHLLLPKLFGLLSTCLEISEQGSTEYTKQLLVSCIYHICQKLTSEDIGYLEKNFDVELVVQTIRTSDNPQTHSQSLLLLSLAATLLPTHVLHNIMAIFTFMGANIMRQDDIYSFQVISRTVETVIPALIKACKGDSQSKTVKISDVVTQIIQVFVDAYPHIPEHRRLPLFNKLLTTVGADDYLWTCFLLLLDGHIMRNSSKEDSEHDRKGAPQVHADVQFCLDISSHFHPSTQVKTGCQILNYLGKIPSDLDEGKHKIKKPRTPKQQPERDILALDTHSGKQIRHLRYVSTIFIAQILSSESFIAKIVSLSDAAVEMVPSYQSMIEENLSYINYVSQIANRQADSAIARFWKVLLHKAYDILDKVNALLPSNVFVDVISGLMSNQLMMVRRKAMEMLNNKLIQTKDSFDEEEVSLFLSLLDPLVEVVQIKQQSEDMAINKQTALFSLKMLCRCFGSKNTDLFKPLLVVTIKLFKESDSNTQVAASSLLCLAELVNSLKAHAIPSLAKFMPIIISTLRNHAGLQSNDLLLLSAVTTLHKVVESLPHFLSPYLYDILCTVVILSGSHIKEEGQQKSQLALRLKAVRHHLATVLPPRVLLPPISKCYEYVQKKHSFSIGSLMGIVTEHITAISKEDLASFHNQILTFFLTALDYRSNHSQEPPSEIAEIESFVIEAVSTMVMKLSEATFKPMFFKLFDWASRYEMHKDRLIVFYRLADCLASRLKSLFTLFIGHIIKNASNLMDENHIGKSDSGTFGSTDLGREKTFILLQYIFDTLHKSFLYDNEGFLDKDKFETLMQPLVDQIENEFIEEEKFKKLVTEHLVPCISHFALAIGDDASWKTMNYQVLLKTRHSSVNVRIAALLNVVEMARKLGDNYSNLLPETVPFLAELMEDDSTEVEQLCQEVVSEMEDIIGEPLQKHF